MISQKDNEFLHHTGPVAFTEITFVPCWNFEIYQVDEKITDRLMPFDHANYSNATMETGTKRMGFNFYYN